MESHCTGDCHIRTYNLAIIGLGNVGSALVALLQRKRQELADRYGIGWQITGVASRRYRLAHRSQRFPAGTTSGTRFFRAVLSRTRCELDACRQA